MPPIDHQYLEWLYSRVASVENINLTRQYTKLFGIFFTEEFIWIHPRDANFAQYGIELREVFVEQTGISLRGNSGFLRDEPCSVLELFIALANKLSDDDPEEREPAYWFWEMMENLGFRNLNDAKIKPEDEPLIRTILQYVMERRYNRKGEGGLFPLQRTRKDQTKVELLYQLEAYLAERT